MGFTVGAIIVEGVVDAAIVEAVAATAITVGEVALDSALIAAGTDVAGMAALDAAAMATAGEVGLAAGVDAAGMAGMDAAAAAADSSSLALGADSAGSAASLAGNEFGSASLADMGTGASGSAAETAADTGLASASLPDSAASNTSLVDYSAQTATGPDVASASTAPNNATSSIAPNTAPTGPDVPGATSPTADVASGSPVSSDPSTLASNEFGANPAGQYGTGAPAAAPTPTGFSTFTDYMKAAAKFAKANPLVTSVGMQVGGGALKGMADASTANKNRAVLQQTADINAARVKQGSYGSDVAGYTPIIASRRI